MKNTPNAPFSPFPARQSASALACGAALIASIASVSAATYQWTGAVSNSLNVAGNWLVGGTVPAAAPTTVSDQPATPSISDIIVFDSATWTRSPTTLYTRTNNRWGSIELKNGTVTYKNDANNQGNYSWGGTNTFVVGDGDATAATLNLNILNWNAGDGGVAGAKTYVVNSDGTLASARTGTNIWSSSLSLNTVMRLIGGTATLTGSLREVGLTDDVSSYISFEQLNSSFTFAKGAAGSFDEATDVTAAFGDSFRLGGSLNSGNAALALADGGTTWTITAIAAIPEPSAAMLFSVCLLAGLSRRRRA